jgi:hypothetical protein
MNVLALMMSLLFWSGGVAEEDLTPIDKEHLLIYGYTVEMLYETDDEGNAPNTRCIVYKNDEIYTAFKSNAKGEYEFNLPKGEVYTLAFGGDDYVNKRVVVDATDCKSKRKGDVIQMDMALFRPVDGVDYAPMEQPIVRWFYDRYESALIPDMSTFGEMRKVVDRLYRKSERLARQ